MVSKSIAIAYSYIKQHRKKIKRIIPKLSFITGETKKKKKNNKTKKKKEKKREREREIREEKKNNNKTKEKEKIKKEEDIYVKCPGRWLSPSNLMQAIFTT
jgi:vacuolar-type H+-ATPase subunit I/STV1